MASGGDACQPVATTHETAVDSTSNVPESVLEPALITVPAEEFQELIPTGAEFEVRSSESAGRYMVSVTPLQAGYDFLIESPLVAWPLAPEALSMESAASRHEDITWCEACLCVLPAREACVSVDNAPCQDGLRQVRRRLSGKRSPKARQKIGNETSSQLYCASCATRQLDHPTFFTPQLFRDWRCWQAARSSKSKVGLEAFARCFAQVAVRAAVFRAEGLCPSDALNEALRPFDRLAAPPSGYSVLLDGTTAAEVSAKLVASEPFASAVATAVGCPDAAARLLAEGSVDALAGRLVLNAAGIEVEGAAPGGNALPAVGVFVLLSTMNHSCAASAEVVVGPSSEVTLRTTRAVEAGEPLTLAYVPMAWSREERRKRLRHWFFECDCPRCESEGYVEAALRG